jgi:putative flavoprotein involved in K+ transport
MATTHPHESQGLRARLLATMPVAEHRRQLAGVSTSILEGGEGPPVVLLHGLGEFAATWTRVIPALVASHRVVAPDLPGHGASRGADGRLDGERMLAWLDELIASTCSAPPVLVGHLLGGTLAARYAARHPATPGGLVLVGAYGLDRLRPTPRFAFALARFLARPTERSQGALMRACLADRDALGEEMGERLWTPEAYALEEARTPGGTAAARTLMPALGLRRIPERELARITAPTSLIWGREDRQVQLRVAEEAAARHGWPLHVIDGAAGDPAIERPKAFLRALRTELGDATDDGEVDVETHDGAERVETVIIGAGQAGLATGHHLARLGRPFVILEADARVGDVWRRRFDSLRLYSPARYDGLPGWAFPGDPTSFPAKDDVADYLEAYARRLALPVVTGARVQRLCRDGGRFAVLTGSRRFEAENVVVASGTFQEPIVPSFAGQLDPRIAQLHSADYRNPSQVADGPVLVVGASHSGADIALELARDHQVLLVGKVHGEVPFDIEGRPARVVLRGLFFLANHVLTMRTPLGRRMRPEVRAHGGPLLRVKRADLRAAGVELAELRVAGVRDGRPQLEDGRVLDVATVVWCTGFGKDLGWIDIPVAGDDGWPEQDRGASATPGLYFVGLPFLHAFGSMLIGGVGRDAAKVADHIAGRAVALS